LGAKGVGSVIERLKRCVREQIAGTSSRPEAAANRTKSKFSREFVMDWYGV